MKNNPARHQRKSIRIKHYDYSQQGIYFLTLCVKDREERLGRIINKEMKLLDLGNIVEYCIIKIEQLYNNTKMHQYIVMPNHIHILIEVVGAQYYATRNVENMNIQEKSKMLIPKIIQQFKTTAIRQSKKYIKEQRLHIMQPKI